MYNSIYRYISNILDLWLTAINKNHQNCFLLTTFVAVFIFYTQKDISNETLRQNYFPQYGLRYDTQISQDVVCELSAYHY
jgi:hypothetical protein